MEEIFQLCDEVTVLRDGQWIATEPLAGLTMDKIIAMMVGRSLNQRFPDKENKPGEVILEVRNLTSLRQPSIRDVSFDLHKGEILGIAGPGGGRNVPILLRRYLVFARNRLAPLRCTAKRSITIMPMKP
ncbi:galactose/methyl galactoside ABC transporter, ATP-binding protein [Escherichia coli]|nr:galactose/methyl galactoside ABC transporter, ATP-binding protein [Escherichia coli]